MQTRRLAKLAAALLFGLTLALPFTPAAAAQGSTLSYTCARKTDGTLWCWGS